MKQTFDLIITISNHEELFGEDETDGLWGTSTGNTPS